MSIVHTELLSEMEFINYGLITIPPDAWPKIKVVKIKYGERTILCRVDGEPCPIIPDVHVPVTVATKPAATPFGTTGEFYIYLTGTSAVQKTQDNSRVASTS